MLINFMLTVSGPQNAGGPQNVGFYKKLKIQPDIPYLGENPYITASLDMIYGIQVVIANFNEKFVFASNRSEKYVQKIPTKIFFKAPWLLLVSN